MKNRKAPGADGITNTAVKHLPPISLDYFAYVINKILELSHFPTSWKEAKVIVFPKPNKDSKFPQNYRPISLLSVLSKLAEKVILYRINIHFHKQKFLRNEQFGFRSGHSTTHQLLRLTEYITHGFNFKQGTGAVFLDVEKAFDRVWHEGLLSKLIDSKLPGRYVHLIRSYLTKRTFRVTVGSEQSTPRPIEAGVPQGSVVGPTLFNVYINDAPKSNCAEIGINADDTVIYSRSRSCQIVERNLQQSLDMLEEWYTKWRVKINVTKSEAIMFTQRPLKHKPSEEPSLFEEDISWKKSVKYLGIHLDSKLKFKHHIDVIAGRARGKLHELFPLLNRKSTLPTSQALTVYKSLIRPIMSYAPSIWGNAAKTHMKKLQVVQNKTLRLITNAHRYTRNAQLHRDLDIVPMKDFLTKNAASVYVRSKKSTNPLIQGLGNYDENIKEKHTRPKAIFTATYHPLSFAALNQCVPAPAGIG